MYVTLILLMAMIIIAIYESYKTTSELEKELDTLEKELDEIEYEIEYQIKEIEK